MVTIEYFSHDHKEHWIKQVTREAAFDFLSARGLDAEYIMATLDLWGFYDLGGTGYPDTLFMYL